MNRESRGFSSSDTLVVVDRSRRQRMALIAGVGLIVVVLLLAGLYFLSTRVHEVPKTTIEYEVNQSADAQ